MNSGSLTLGKIKTGNVKSVKSAKKAAVNIWTQKFSEATIIKITVAFLILTLIGAGSWKVTKFYNGKIFPNIKVAGVKIGGKNPAQAKIAVQSYIDKINAEGIVINNADQKINPKLNELGLNFNNDQVVNDAYKYGRSGSWKTRVKDNFMLAIGRANIKMTPQVDEQKFNDQLGKIISVVEVAPQNAGIVIDNGNISVTPSKIGRGVDKTKLKNDLTALINTNKLDTQISVAVTDLQPAVKEPGTVAAQGQAARFMQAAPISLTYQDKNFTAAKADIGKWIEFSAKDDQLVANVSNDKIGEYAAWVAKQITISKVDRVTMEGTGQVLEEGRDGLGVDTKSLVKDLNSRVLSAKNGSAIAIVTYSIPKGEITKNPHAQPGRYTGHYIDINLSEQTLYAFNGSELVNQFLISSGKSGYGTPEGQFAVWGKTRAQTMDGPGYSLPNVEWISWFNGEISIHGTYWHNNFGTPMSHGCINASNLNAEWVYNFVEEGTPVYVHY